MTITARTVPKFCAHIRAALPEIFFLGLISLVISGTIEPWPECQPEESYMIIIYDQLALAKTGNRDAWWDPRRQLSSSQLALAIGYSQIGITAHSQSISWGDLINVCSGIMFVSCENNNFMMRF